jgi:flagellin
MRVLDSASGLLSRLQELAVLGANDTNTTADATAIDAEAEAIADEFHRLMSTSTYKGKDVFVDTAGGEYVSMGGRDAEMTFGLGKVQYSNMYLHSYLEYASETAGVTVAATDAETIFNAKNALDELNFDTNTSQSVLIENVAYELTTAMTDDDAEDEADVVAFTDYGDVAVVGGADNGQDFEEQAAADGTEGAQFISTATGQTTSGRKFAKQEGQLLYAASEGMQHTTDANGTPDTNLLTAQIEVVQARLNTARVQAGSQYAALESAVNYTTDLTAQYELGYNTVNDVNFSMETAHLAKNQILQQAATAMLAQANQGQQGLLQLIS